MLFPYDREEAQRVIAKMRSLANDLEAFLIHDRTPIAEVEIAEWSIATIETQALVGRPSGHPSLQDGRLIQTSELFFISERMRLARTLSRWYRLGERSR